MLCGDNTIYTGVTTDVERRFAQHNEGTGAKYTRSRKVKKILYVEPTTSRSAALIREAAIKKLTKQKKKELYLNKL